MEKVKRDPLHALAAAYDTQAEAIKNSGWASWRKPVRCKQCGKWHPT